MVAVQVIPVRLHPVVVKLLPIPFTASLTAEVAAVCAAVENDCPATRGMATAPPRAPSAAARVTSWRNDRISAEGDDPEDEGQQEHPDDRELEEGRPVIAPPAARLRGFVDLPSGHARSRRVTNGWVRPKQVSVRRELGTMAREGDLWGSRRTSHPVAVGVRTGAAPPRHGPRPGLPGGRRWRRAVPSTSWAARWWCRGRWVATGTAHTSSRVPSTSIDGAVGEPPVDAGDDLLDRRSSAGSSTRASSRASDLVGRLGGGGAAEPDQLGPVGAGPHAGHGRQVVGRHDAEAGGRVGAGRVVLEPHHAGREHVGGGQLGRAGRPPRCRGPRRRRARRPAGSRWPAPRGAPGRRSARSRRPRRGCRRAPRRAGRGPSRGRRAGPRRWPSTRGAARRRAGSRPGPEAPRHERRQAPDLAVGREVVRRGADAHVEGEEVLEDPGVGAVGVGADGQVLDQPHAPDGRGAASWSATRSCSQAWNATRSARSSASGGDGRGRPGGAAAAGQAGPPRSVHLGQRAVAGPVLEGRAAARARQARRGGRSRGRGGRPRGARGRRRWWAQQRSRSTIGSASRRRAAAASSADDRDRRRLPGSSSTRSRSGLRQRRLDGRVGAGREGPDRGRPRAGG